MSTLDGPGTPSDSVIGCYPMTISDLPALNACLNALSALLLLKGYIEVRSHRIERHRRFMLGALASSGAFLVSYLVYHAVVGSVPYPLYDWTRILYFTILLPHVILAAVMAPFVLLLVWHAFRGNFLRHQRLARRVWPVWMFVSMSGVAVYLMLYHWAAA